MVTEFDGENYDEMIEILENAAEDVKDIKKRSYIGSVANFLTMWKGQDEGFARILSKKKIDNKEDFMVIKKIPDIFVSGHLHNPDVSVYNNVITINASCWQATTDFQVKVGNLPDPCKVPVLNLRTRKVEVLDFNE